MTPDDNLNTTQWAAFIALLLLLMVPLAVALAAWCKRRYAAAVVQLQSSTVGAAPAVAADERRAPLPAADDRAVAHLEVDLRPAHQAAQPDAGADPGHAARRLRRRVLAVQFTSGLLYWWALLLCFAVALLMLSQATGSKAEGSPSAGALALHMVLWPLLVLPAALAWAFQAGVRESRVWAVAGVTMAIFGVGIIFSGTGWLAGGAFAGACALLALMLAAFMRPAVRGAGPPLVAAFTVGLLVFSALVALVVLLDDSPENEATTAGEWAAAAGALVAMLGVAAFAAWRMLLRLARRYAAKRFSELQLALGAYWALITAFTLGIVLLMSFEGRTGASMEWVGLAILVLWLVWRWLQRGALWLARRHAPAPLGALLLLRVFKPSSRSEAFTERFLAHWRFAAPVWMIAGPDLAGAFMEPDEFFAWLGKRLAERFIANPAEVGARIEALDNARDPDGRFRVNELFCANSTWQPAVLALIARAGVVLLDLREYSRQRAGTRFELVELLRRAPLCKVLVIVDARDDVARLEAEIQSIWQEVARDAQRLDPAPRLQLLQLGDGSDAEMRGLFSAAAAAAGAGGSQGRPAVRP